MFSLDDTALVALLEARAVLEPETAAIAARRVSDQEVVELEALHSRATAADGDGDEFPKLDLELHRLTRICRYPMLDQIKETVGQLVGDSVTRMLMPVVPVVRSETLSDHAAIIATSGERDPPRAHADILNHFHIVEAGLRQAGYLTT